MYQCIYCKAQYEHKQSYKHNAYDCPKQKGKKMKGIMASVLVICMLGLSGCQLLEQLYPAESIVADKDKANITVFKGDKSYTYSCDIDQATKEFTNCIEVK